MIARALIKKLNCALARAVVGEVDVVHGEMCNRLPYWDSFESSLGRRCRVPGSFSCRSTGEIRQFRDKHRRSLDVQPKCRRGWLDTGPRNGLYTSAWCSITGSSPRSALLRRDFRLIMVMFVIRELIERLCHGR
jgi:hypothetical protein